MTELALQNSSRVSKETFHNLNFQAKLFYKEGYVELGNKNDYKLNYMNLGSVCDRIPPLNIGSVFFFLQPNLTAPY